MIDIDFYKYKIKNCILKIVEEQVWGRIERKNDSAFVQNIIYKQKYGSRIVHEKIETDKRIQKLLLSDEPCMIARFGYTELAFLYAYVNDQHLNSGRSQEKLEKAFSDLCFLSGFFPNAISLTGGSLIFT